jgi:hypothetical protein
MLITSIQEDNKEEIKEDNKEDNKENITMSIYKQPLLTTQTPVKLYLDTDILNNKNIEMKQCKNYFINYIKNNIKNATIKNNSKSKEKKCWCYNKESQDMRCCGLCYTCCYFPNKDDQCYMCPETFETYYTSGYVITTDGSSRTGEDCEDCLCTTLCLPIKLSLFFPCLVGSLFNNSINYCRNTNTNYLC